MGSIQGVARVVCSVLLTAALGLGVGCGGKKKASDEDEGPAACKTNDDCEKGLVCLGGECADPRVNTGPSNMVTPEKVKNQVEDINKAADERNQKALDL